MSIDFFQFFLGSLQTYTGLRFASFTYLFLYADFLSSWVWLLLLGITAKLVGSSGEGDTADI